MNSQDRFEAYEAPSVTIDVFDVNDSIMGSLGSGCTGDACPANTPGFNSGNNNNCRQNYCSNVVCWLGDCPLGFDF